jgi:hypothetical protein
LRTGLDFGGHGFPWLTHLDRQLISPMELLTVSAYKPHELTHKFDTTNPVTGLRDGTAHLAPWTDQRARLYRVFELLETASRPAGNSVGGRTPGLVNLNTVWDQEILEALADAQPSNSFYGDQNKPPNYYVDQVFRRQIGPQQIYGMITSRTPGGIPGPNDRPFRPFLTGVTAQQDLQYPRGIGINDTLLRSADPNDATTPTGGVVTPRLFEAFSGPPGSPNYPMNPPGNPTTHPYLRTQMLTKLFNNVTTRSNVFAVWVTVGFFKVEDDTSFPVKLGAEVGKAENRHIRHRMFAIVDRSAITIDPSTGGPGRPPIYLAGSFFDTDASGDPMIAVSGATYDAATRSLKGFYETVPWAISASAPYNSLTIDYGGPDLSQNQDQQQVFEKQGIVVKAVTPGNPTGNPPTPDTFTLDKTLFAPPKPIASPPVPSHPSPFLISVPYVPPGTPLGKVVPVNNRLGNPGPVQTWPNPPLGPGPRFDPRAFPWVVRYFSIIN